jgi:hypothetical protein
MREIVETPQPSLQYNIESFDHADNLDDFRTTAHQMGLRALDRASDRTLTPIYFSSYAAGNGLEGGMQKSSQNYYQIKNNFGKI